MKENSKEYIVCSAIHYLDGNEYDHQPNNIENGFVICGLRHHNCLQIINNAQTQEKENARLNSEDIY